MTEEYKKYEYDVIVIGAGGAGLRAAIESARTGAKTAIITKSLLGKAHTVMAEGGCAAALLSKSSRVVVREEQYAFLVPLPLLTTTKLSKSHFIAQAQTQSKSIKIMT